VVGKVSGREGVYFGMAQFPASTEEMAPEAIQGVFSRMPSDVLD
jgi:hypothetical protein